MQRRMTSQLFTRRARLAWLSLAQTGLACTNILATLVMMISLSLQSPYSWSLYSGPWVLLSSLFLLYYWWYSDHSPLRDNNIVRRQKLQVRIHSREGGPRKYK